MQMRDAGQLGQPPHVGTLREPPVMDKNDILRDRVHNKYRSLFFILIELFRKLFFT